jgi:hypothetical protein
MGDVRCELRRAEVFDFRGGIAGNAKSCPANRE